MIKKEAENTLSGIDNSDSLDCFTFDIYEQAHSQSLTGSPAQIETVQVNISQQCFSPAIGENPEIHIQRRFCFGRFTHDGIFESI